MIELGRLAVCLALVCSLFAVAASIAGVGWRRADLVRSGENAAFACWALVALATGILLQALLARDFSVEYVASYSSSTLPTHYTVAALWGGQKGSLLFWAFMLTSFTAIVEWQNRQRNRDLMPYVTAVLMVVAAFFLGLVTFVTDPFERLARPAAEGADLNPLLQNYWMMIHPPSLYTGYVSASVPFAFAIAALATGRLGDRWIRTTRRWALFSWFFLSLGNLFGAMWAYEVLGWGGYWAWDPVENAAFMPWLVSTAYLHSVMIQEKKDMLRVWNMVLVLLTFALTIFGTFLTRSGVISSVHSFTQSGLGPFFIAFLLLVLLVSGGLIAYRLPELRTRGTIESFLSREAAFLFNNLILVGIAFAVFWGTVFPVISEWVRGVKITVGPPFFNRVNAPLGVALLFLMGVGPVIAWRRATARNLYRAFAGPVAAGLVAWLVLLLGGMPLGLAQATFALGVFVLGTVVQEFWRGMRARQTLLHERAPTALARVVGKNRRRYGGYVIHVGIVMMFVGIAASSAFRIEAQRTLKPGDVTAVGRYTLRYARIERAEDGHLSTLAAVLDVSTNGQPLTVLRPEKRFYKKPQQPTTEVANRSTLREDLYVVLGSYDEKTQLITILAYVNPLVVWIWIGGLVLTIGTAITVWPSAVERRAPLAAGALEAERA
ncbi:MAG TPA: heme lyase CcmF/NrfE family subunit [Candidatus Limnocylindria bacterium]|nr:heme lyase CcmF/NrfE family subunit [Candidatus Limnocylindria bacterium]